MFLYTVQCTDKKVHQYKRLKCLINITTKISSSSPSPRDDSAIKQVQPFFFVSNIVLTLEEEVSSSLSLQKGRYT